MDIVENVEQQVSDIPTGPSGDARSEDVTEHQGDEVYLDDLDDLILFMKLTLWPLLVYFIMVIPLCLFVMHLCETRGLDMTLSEAFALSAQIVGGIFNLAAIVVVLVVLICDAWDVIIT